MGVLLDDNDTDDNDDDDVDVVPAADVSSPLGVPPLVLTTSDNEPDGALAKSTGGSTTLDGAPAIVPLLLLLPLLVVVDVASVGDEVVAILDNCALMVASDARYA